MPKFRKKPVMIEAWQLDFDRWGDKPWWLLNAINFGAAWASGGESPYLTIATLEGEMRANVGDWIIKGVKDEIYPCKSDIFAATYDSADDEGHP